MLFRSNEVLKPLSDALQNVLSSESQHSLLESNFRLDQLLREVAPIDGELQTVYSYYEGSLTTPGCNEVVEWINFLTPLKISQNQLEMFRSLFICLLSIIFDCIKP